VVRTPAMPGMILFSIEAAVSARLKGMSELSPLLDIGYWLLAVSECPAASS